MTITSAAGMDFARQLGCYLVVLARECSVKEIAKIDRAQAAPLPLEVFVHGALCVAYSGQCLTSEALGGRSANRGECAQACRMPYDLICDGQPVPLGDRRYLLSPQDLAGLEVLPDLIRAGVASLKIEGRLKSPEYVANITRFIAGAGQSSRRSGRRPAAHRPDALRLGNGLFARTPHRMVRRHQPSTAGPRAFWQKTRRLSRQRCGAWKAEEFSRSLKRPSRPATELYLTPASPTKRRRAAASIMWSRRVIDSLVVLDFGRDDLDFNRIHLGDRVWKTSDPELDRRLAPKFCRPDAPFPASPLSGSPRPRLRPADLDRP